MRAGTEAPLEEQADAEEIGALGCGADRIVRGVFAGVVDDAASNRRIAEALQVCLDLLLPMIGHRTIAEAVYCRRHDATSLTRLATTGRAPRSDGGMSIGMAGSP